VEFRSINTVFTLVKTSGVNKNRAELKSVKNFNQLFFRASLSPYATLASEYVSAEEEGRRTGFCSRYEQECPRSIFQDATG